MGLVWSIRRGPGRLTLAWPATGLARCRCACSLKPAVLSWTAPGVWRSFLAEGLHAGPGPGAGSGRSAVPSGRGRGPSSSWAARRAACTKMTWRCGSGLPTQGIGQYVLTGSLLEILGTPVASWTYRGRELPYLPNVVTPRMTAAIATGGPVALGWAAPDLSRATPVAGQRSRWNT